jgi:hypothetical protein
MAGPWENYAAPASDGPWTKYAAEPQEAAAEPERPSSLPDGQRYGSREGGAAEALLSAGSAAIAAPVAGLAGLASIPFTDNPAGVVEKVQGAFTYQPRTMIGQKFAETIGIPFQKLAEGADYVGGKVADATGSPALGAATNTAIQAAPGLVGLRGKVGNGRSNSRPNTPLAEGAPEASPAPAAQAGRNPGLARVPEKPPSIDELRTQKTAAYKRAEETGVVVSRGAINRLKVDLVSDLKKEGLDVDLHPKANAALKRVLNSRGQLTLSEIETLRKIANDAKGSIDKSDARLGAKIVDHIDEFEANLSDADVISGTPAAATAFKEARSLNTRFSKATELEELVERARLSAPNFSGSGMENALRTEFRGLAKNKSKMRRFNAAEQVAIKKVAMGGPLENAMRMLGKFAPRGPISTGFGFATAATAGPLGLAVPLAGEAGRFAATRMTMKNVNRASELVRAGPQKNALAVPRKRNALVE